MQLENQVPQSSYDPRWFIWTIVFLVSTGVMLVTYITTTGNNDDVGVSDVATAAHHSRVSK